LRIEMICSSVYRLRFILGPPWGQITRKSHIPHGSDYGGTVKSMRKRRARNLTAHTASE